LNGHDAVLPRFGNQLIDHLLHFRDTQFFRR
jgi:hypothetical protein